MAISSKALKGVAGTGIVFGALYAGVFGWTHWQLARLESDWTQRLAQERSRSAELKMPVVGAPLSGNAAPLYAPLLEKAKVWEIPPVSAAWLKAHQSDLQQLRQVLRHDHCDWKFPYEAGLSAPIPPFMGAKRLAEALIASGKADKDPHRYLEVLRLGADLSNGGLIIGHVVGAQIQKMALDAIQQQSPTLAPPSIKALLRGLGPFEATLPSATLALRSEQLAFASVGPETRSKLKVWAPMSVIEGALMAHTAASMNAFYEQAIGAAQNPDRAQRDRAIAEAAKRMSQSPNPLVAIAMPDLTKMLARLDQTVDQYGAVRAELLAASH